MFVSVPCLFRVCVPCVRVCRVCVVCVCSVCLPASEAIAAGRLIGTRQFILLHGQVAGGAVSLKVKTVDAGFTRALAVLAQGWLTGAH